MEKNYGMKWHKYLIYFELWLDAAAALLLAYACFKIVAEPFGRYRGLHSDKVPFMAVLGIVLLAAAVCLIVARFKLARFKTGAYKFLLGVQVVSNVAYGIFLAIDTDASLFNIVLSMIVPLLTYYYYTKRAELFVN